LRPDWNYAVPPGFEIIEHPADVGFLAYGRTLEELFVHAAAALMSLACEPAGIKEREQREIEAAGTDNESLLYAWLAEILALGDAEKMFFCRATVTELGSGRVRGLVYGERYDKQRHRAGTYLKAVTYHNLLVEQVDDGWRAQVYLDV